MNNLLIVIVIAVVVILIILLATGKSNTKQQNVFEQIYDTNKWGDAESISGKGSSVEITTVLRSELQNLLDSYGIRTMIDAPTGDFNWMQHMNLSRIHYLGVDIVSDLIKKNTERFGSNTTEFRHLDVIKESLPKVDLILCRDLLVHLPFAEIQSVLNNFKQSGSTYLLATTFTEHKENRNIRMGNWRKLNLQLAPFNFPKPIALLYEGGGEERGKDKHLGLWRLSDL